ncbi:MAG: autotransporter outer membrane beta-barrel domain-containing protein [Endomicrobium sp.]|nr:autotransporter outer membrane beta-barrel domain-containing protein [Endomicrobium sp.]
MNSNKVNIFPNVNINSSYTIGVCGAYVLKAKDNILQMFKNVINIFEGTSLQATNQINIIAAICANTTDISSFSYSTENIVSIHKNVSLNAPQINILGTRLSNTGSININNNTLNFHANKECIVTKVGNSTNYNFYLYEGIKAGNTVLSFASGESNDPTITKEALNLEDTNIDISMAKENSLQLGDSITLMHCDAGFINFSGVIIDGEYKSPLFARKASFGLTLDEGNNNIMSGFSAGGIVLNERSKQYSQGRAVGVAFVNQGGDFLAGKGIEELDNITGEGIVPFGAVEFGKSKYKTGSDANPNIDGYEVLAGIGKNFEYEEDKVVVGVFFEQGGGYYKIDSESVQGEAKGNNSYIGAGLLGKLKLGGDRKIAGLYVDGGVRVGNGKIDYKTSGEWLTVPVEELKYDYNALYYGLHLGAGYSYKIDDKVEVEGFGRYTFMMQEGKNIKIEDDNMKFNEVMSHRIRVGVKGKFKVKTKMEAYIGIAGEQELDGEIKAKALYNGKEIESLKLAGTIGVGEIGLNYGIGNRWNIGISAEGFVGNREGFLGSCWLSYAI